MATTIQDELYKTFLEVSGQQTSALSSVSLTLADVLTQVHELQAADPPPNAKIPAAAPASTAKSTGDVLSSVASTVLQSGFGVTPLISGLLSLFGGGEPEKPPPLVKYALPPSIDFQAAQTGTEITGLDYDQQGLPRVYRQASTSTQTTAAPNSSGGSPAPVDAARPTSQVTVNVQAMDVRSFLDRSNEIALAVREAMLNMNSINDVVNEL